MRGVYLPEAEAPRAIYFVGLDEKTQTEKLLALKDKLKAFKYDAYIVQDKYIGKFFDLRSDSDNFAHSFKPGVSVKVVDMPAAEIVLDNDVNVLSTTGGVAKIPPDLDQQKRVKEAQNFLASFSPVAKMFGWKIGEATNLDFVGKRFKFVGFEPNWLPPGATVQSLPANKLKISTPHRYLVSAKYARAFVVKDLDQFKFLELSLFHSARAPGLGLVKGWEQRYSATLLDCSPDSMTLYFRTMPKNLGQFERDIDGMGADLDQDWLKTFKETRTIYFRWDG